MTFAGHRASGWGAAAMAFSMVHLYQGLPWLAAVAAWFGATAPDWLELAWFSKGVRRSLIRHRTLTHWVLLWVVLLIAGWWWLTHQWWASALAGFAVGGLLHLLLDWPNPSGIHWLHPFRRKSSLNAWRADQGVAALVLLTWCAGGWSLYAAGLVAPHWLARMTALLEWGWIWVRRV